MDNALAGIASSEGLLDRFAAARDLWPGGTIEMWAGRPAPLPDRIFWPADADEVERVVREASARGIPVVPYGAGSGVCGGARGRVGTIVLDTKRLDGIGPLDASRWTVEVDAGVNGQHLEDWLAERGFTLGHSPSSIWCSTVGGWAAARSAGQFSSRYGVFEDMVLAVEGVAPGHGRFRVGEGGDVPDAWMPLILGSEGTLAVVTRVKLKVWPQPAVRWLRGYRFATVGAAIDAMRRIMQSELWPSVLRLYDPVDTRIGGRTKPHKAGGADRSFVRRWLSRASRIQGVKGQTLALPLALPGLVNRVFDRVSEGVLLVVGWEGDAGVVEAASSAGKALLDEAGQDLGSEPGERWLHSRHHVSYKLMPIFERGGFADTMEVAVHWSALERLYHAVREAVSDHVVVMAHMSHLYPEGGSIYFSFAGRGSRDVYDETWRRALAAVVACGATVTHHHGVGILKAEAVTREVGPAVEAWASLKRALDPAGILNPGRVYVPGVALPGPEADPPPLSAEDGVVRMDLPAVGDPGRLAWPWESLPAPPRWMRPWWQTGAVEVSGAIDGIPVRLGRGPRSASGPDAREWFLPRATAVTLAAAPDGPRWMGEGKPDRAWVVAQALLRSDLRPSVLTVRAGVLRVGFRGPAA
nr:FAD-binding oxidoreductase [Deltaproteobacteria bacterium]